MGFLICKMGIVIVSSLPEWLWEVNAIIHIKCSAQNLTFAKFSLLINNNNHSD